MRLNEVRMGMNKMFSKEQKKKKAKHRAYWYFNLENLAIKTERIFHQNVGRQIELKFGLRLSECFIVFYYFHIPLPNYSGRFSILKFREECQVLFQFQITNIKNT